MSAVRHYGKEISWIEDEIARLEASPMFGVDTRIADRIAALRAERESVQQQYYRASARGEDVGSLEPVHRFPSQPHRIA